MEVFEMNLMKNSETKWLPDGFHFLGPTESEKRKSLIENLSGFLIQEGYSEVILPAMDYSHTFLNRIHPEEESSVLRYRDLNGQELSPGTDLTVQVVKGMAGLSHLTENQNVFYIAKRIRDHKKRNASRREILQIGAERLGSSQAKDILKILLELDSLFRIAGLDRKPVLVLGNNLLIRKILESRGLGDRLDFGEDLRTFIHTKNATAIQAYAEEKNFSPELTETILKLLEVHDLDSTEKFLDETGQGILDPSECKKLQESISVIRDGWNQETRFSNLKIDLSLVRDLNYYTGFLFQGYIAGVPEPIVTGGQYDHLFQVYSGRAKDACGYALNMDIFIDK